MPHPEAIRAQLEDLGDLLSIVRTMKALSAVSIRQYERAVVALQDYSRTVELGLHVVLRSRRAPPARAKERDVTVGALVFGSDHGLCGRFNEDIAAHAHEHLRAAEPSIERWRILTVGARATAGLERLGLVVEDELLVPGSASQIARTIERLLARIDTWRGDTEPRLHVFHNRPVRGRPYRPTDAELLPIDLGRFHRLEESPWPSKMLPTYRQEPELLLEKLLRQHLFISLFRACAESQATEHASRLAAMQAAERNLSDHIDEITGRFRRARQEEITAELLDVLSGFESVRGDDDGKR
ncbi:MAG: F0F1 ATP synthase subunit gamma [Planctomycetota bacterium]